MRKSLLLVVSTLTLALGCSEEKPSDASATATTTAPAPKPASSASAASSAPANRSDCPKDSAGPGTFQDPCLGKGTTRLMEAKWNGKTDDKGPWFSVTNKSSLTILFGKVIVYFYDKSGKQLEVPGEGKKFPYRSCSGNSLFGGTMKPGDNYRIQFSCVTKADVPANTAAMEAEISQVGFADAAGAKSEFFWSNPDLTPDVRPQTKEDKGAGAKPPPKK